MSCKPTFLAPLLLLVAGSAFAQPKGPPPVGGPGGPRRGGPGGGWGMGMGVDQNLPPDELRKQVMERMRAMRAWKLAEELKLDEATSAKLFPLLSKYDDREMDLMKERNDVMRAMRAEIEAPKPDNARLGGYVDRLLGMRGKQRALEDDKIKELRKVLAPVQQAKLIMLLPRIDQHFHERIRDAMNQRRRGPGMPGANDF